MIACAFCAQQAASPSASLVVFGLVALPFAIAAVLFRAIRKLQSGGPR
jgi:hypothetical protein